MHSTLIVGRMDPAFTDEVVRLFSAFDATEMPRLMGTRRRELFTYHGLYFHLQDFETEHGDRAIAAAREHPLFVEISKNLKPFINAYDPGTWRSPGDAIASRFYHWQESA
ncbi:TcmI family type II polyketide cyclase [Streptomyces sp. YIM 98790]|uniref:TcmI family type II polyketide cyclase n=1 Tax=Streptomyces sp. YIM 98790 TaxID=2689077 RepID=UPI00140C0544|nr:TcmI family type II polyketide cyclase [Streptomyces sp. YIM 98790]